MIQDTLPVAWWARSLSSQRSESDAQGGSRIRTVQTELYKDPDDVQAMFDRRYENVVFNGGGFATIRFTPSREGISWKSSRVSGRAILFYRCGAEQLFSRSPHCGNLG